MVHNYYAPFFYPKKTNTNLVFGIKILYFYVYKTILIMSRELTEFSALIDEQFEIVIVHKISFGEYLLSLFSFAG